MRILMPVDGSDCSKAAVAFVASRVTLLKNPTEIELINVQQPVPPRVARALGKEIVQAHYDAEAGKALKTAAAALRRAGANTTARYVVGSVPRELATLVASDPADLIVMGSTGFGRARYLPMGSVAARVAARCPTALLLVRDKQGPRAAETVPAEGVAAAS